MNNAQSSRFKTLPWHLLVICFCMYLYNLGGGWVIVATIVAGPSLYVLAGCIKHAFITRTQKNQSKTSQERPQSSNKTKEKSLSMFHFKDAEAAFSYAQEYLCNTTQCVGIIRHEGEKNHSMDNNCKTFQVSAAYKEGVNSQYFAVQVPHIKNLKTGDFVFLTAIPESELRDIDQDVIDSVGTTLFIITARLQTVYSIDEGGWLNET